MIVNVRLEAPDGEALASAIEAMEARAREHGCRLVGYKVEGVHYAEGEEVGTPEAQR